MPPEPETLTYFAVTSAAEANQFVQKPRTWVWVDAGTSWTIAKVPIVAGVSDDNLAVVATYGKVPDGAKVLVTRNLIAIKDPPTPPGIRATAGPDAIRRDLEKIVSKGEIVAIASGKGKGTPS